MKKKAIERIPYIGLKKNIRPKTVKYTVQIPRTPEEIFLRR